MLLAGKSAAATKALPQLSRTFTTDSWNRQLQRSQTLNLGPFPFSNAKRYINDSHAKNRSICPADNSSLKESSRDWISIGVMKFNKLDRAKLHLMCLFKNPKGWRFYLKGVLRELGIDLSKF